MPVVDLSHSLSPSRAIAILTNSPYALLPAPWQKIWSTVRYRCATDGAANHLRPLCENGIALPLPDLVTGDFDSIKLETKEYLQTKNVEVIETEDQNNTDLTKLLQIVCQRKELKWDSLFILGGFGGRFDHTLASINSLIQALKWTHKPIFLLDHENLTTVLPKGHSKIIFSPKLSSIFPKNCGLVPVVQRQTIVTSKGLRWNLSNTILEFGGLISTSNEIAAHEVEIDTNEPLVFTLHTDWKNFVV